MLRNLLLLTIVFLIAGCSQGLYNQGRQLANEGEYDRAIDVLYQEIKVNPQNAEAWRELGIAFYKKGDIKKSEDALHQANGIKPDARTNLFLGLIHEKNENTDQAITSYRAAMGYKPKSDTRRMIQTRLDYLISQNIQQEVSFALENESDIQADAIPENSIAVVDFDSEHLSPELAPISKGLAEFTAMDLAKVSSLKVVDRLKIDVLLKELKMSGSGYVNPATAPRLGRLIGSNRIVTGSLVGLGDETIRLDGAIVSTRDSLTQTTEPAEASAEKFFELQKAFVFDVIESLDIQLTAEERDAIQEVPTESYLAFMAFCRGLDYESKGMAVEAKREYSIAARNDVSFKQATTKREAASRQATSGSGPSGSLASFESEVVSTESDIVETALDQFQTVNLSTSSFMQGLGEYGSTVYSPLRSLFGDNVIIIIRGNFDGRD